MTVVAPGSPPPPPPPPRGSRMPAQDKAELQIATNVRFRFVRRMACSVEQNE